MKSLILLLTFFFLIPETQAAEPTDLCNTLNNPSPNGVAYTPGVDVHGKTVVPADLDNTANQAFNMINIPIDLNLAERYGLNIPDGIELKPTVSNLQIYPDGHVEYNGQDITDKVKTDCKITKTDGQKAPDAVVSSDKIEGQFPEDK